jgi:HSP20 family protein
MSNKLTRFDPLSELSNFEPLRTFEDFFRDFRLIPAQGIDAQSLIKMDVSETDQAYAIKAEIPGVKKEDIKVDIDRNRVSISAENKKEIEERDGQSFIRSERYFGQQYRSFTLAHEIDNERALAKYADGILTLSLPKKAGNTSKKLSVN